MPAFDPPDFYRALFDQNGDALFAADADTDRVSAVNPAARRLTGFADEDLIGRPVSDLFRSDTPGGMDRLRTAAGAGGFYVRTADPPGWRPAAVTASALPSWIVYAVRDDGDRRAALDRAATAEAEVRHREAWFRALVERCGEGVSVLDAHGRFTYSAPGGGQVLGYTPGDNIGSSALDFVHPDDRPAAAAALARVLADPGSTVRHTMRCRAAAGDWRTCDMTVANRLADPDVRGLVVNYRDVTEREAQAAELRRQHALLDAVIRAIPDVVLVKDAELRFAAGNPAFEALAGMPMSELLGRHCIDVFPHQDWADRCRTAEQVVMAEGTCLRAEDTITYPDGRETRQDVILSPLLGDDGRFAGLVLVGRDMTTREAQAAELRRQHGLLDAVLRTIPDVVVVKDAGLQVVTGNPAYEALAGRPIAELIGQTQHHLFPQVWADRCRAHERRVLDTGRGERYEDAVSVRGGPEARFDFLLTPLPGEAGRPAGLVVVGRDVTEQRRLEDELRQAQKMDAIGQLAGGVAHDFNNLLTVILGNLELIRAAGGRPAEEMVTSTERAAKRAAELTAQLLGFARRRPLAARPVDVADTVRETAALLRRTIDPRITLVAEAAPAVAAADPGQLAQVLMNLGLNARDAMPAGGVLTLAAAGPRPMTPPPGVTPVPGGYVRLTVADTGVGMDEGTRARIFEPFFTTKPVGEGTGLGLAVVFGIVAAHGGWIDCRSAPGQGTRFDVYLPAADASAPAAGTPPPMPSPLGGGERVLVADDEEMVRTLADIALTRVGYRVTTAADGAEAVERFRTDGPFDLVVLDLTMPVLSGAEALAAVRRLVPGQKVLLASGYAADRVGPAASADGFLEKPYTPTMLAKAVRDVLGP